MDLGVIGLGLMGRAIAVRLLDAGFGVSGYDIDSNAAGRASSLGVDVQPDALAVAWKSQLIILSLFSSQNRRDLLWGAQSLANGLKPGAVILDTTTGRPEDIEDDGIRLADAGIKLVDVCLSGSSQTMAGGRAIALVGDTEASAGYKQVLKAFSQAQYYFGGLGQGNRVKLIVNMVFGLHRLVLAEALGLAERAGFDLNVILDVLKSGETYSAAMDAKGPKMIAGTYDPPVARLAQHAKDVHLIIEYARQTGANAPLSEAHAKLIDHLISQGYGELDNAAIFKAYQ